MCSGELEIHHLVFPPPRIPLISVLCTRQKVEQGGGSWKMVTVVWLQGQLCCPSLPSSSISSKHKCVYPGKAPVVVAVAFLSMPSHPPLRARAVSAVLVPPVVPAQLCHEEGQWLSQCQAFRREGKSPPCCSPAGSCFPSSRSCVPLYFVCLARDKYSDLRSS